MPSGASDRTLRFRATASSDVAVDELEGRRHDALADDAGDGADGVARPNGTSRAASPAAGGFGTSRRMIFVMMASVPSDPTSRCVRS